MEAEIVQRFLESVGAKADIDLYLRLHRAQRKESFAMLAPNAQIVKGALDPLHFDLRILAGLGLLPVVVLGLLEPKDADAQAARVSEWLVEDAVPCEVVHAGADPAGPISAATIDAIRAIVARGAIPLVSLEASKDQTTEARFAMLASLAAALETRKVLFLSRRPGLVPNGGPTLPVVSLATDTPHLLASGVLPRGQAMLLKQAKLLVESVPQRLSVTVVNPLQLLRELFTVNGAGTLIRRGSRIDVRTSWDGLDRARIEALFASAFERSVRADFFAQPLARIFVEENYSGVAVVQDSPVAPYLTKFAVERQAQGEGIGGELWSMLVRDFPRFFWRSRASNQINTWYAKQCDGFARTPEWHIFWRGIQPGTIEAAIRYALGLPSDFG
jgi:GNAT superfamily N-acetyltransferase